SNHVYRLSLGARVRGLEATVDGWLKKDGSLALLHIRGTNVVLRLAPLQVKVQQEVSKKRPASATPAETSAYHDLLAHWNGDARLARITGPLVRRDDTASFALEVRQFDWLPKSEAH